MHTPTRVSLCLRGSRKAPKDMEVMHSTGSTTLKMLEKAMRLAWKAKLSWAVCNNNIRCEWQGGGKRQQHCLYHILPGPTLCSVQARHIAGAPQCMWGQSQTGCQWCPQ